MLLDAQTDQTNTWVPLDPARTQLRRAMGSLHVTRGSELRRVAMPAAKPLAIETNDFGGSLGWHSSSKRNGLPHLDICLGLRL